MSVKKYARAIAAGVLLAVPFLLAGCGPAKTYFKDRALDFWDCFQIEVSVGDGILVNARVTKLVQAGWGFYTVEKVGFFGRQCGHWFEKRNEVGISLFYLNSNYKAPIEGNTYFMRYFDQLGESRFDDAADIRQDIDRHWEDVGFVIHPLKMGLDIAWRNLEFFDFLSGWFMIDFLYDDTRHINEPPPPFKTHDVVY